jgi:hypothetical protein
MPGTAVQTKSCGVWCGWQTSSVTDEGVSYLEAKQQLLLSYCINMTFYMLLKVREGGTATCALLLGLFLLPSQPYHIRGDLALEGPEQEDPT